MGGEPRSFPLLYRAMVSAGESSGSLPLLMERLADLLERQAEMRGKVITAVAYPLILAVFAVLVVAALMMFVVPKVVEQFDTMGQRSEEHTSELQSLMRLSSAVFCLKKKKNRRMITYNNEGTIILRNTV